MQVGEDASGGLHAEAGKYETCLLHGTEEYVGCLDGVGNASRGIVCENVVDS